MKNDFGKHINFTIEENGCWISDARYFQRDGYPLIRINGKFGTVHHHIYEMVFGNLAKGTVVRHKCDNILCINPTHLEAGSHADNVKDRVKRGRSAFGERNGRAKLTENQAKQIKYNNESSIRILAEKYGVDPKAIRLIKQGINWRHI